MRSPTLARSAVTYDWIESRWESLATQRRVATVLVVVFLVGLAVIEVNRRGWLPDGIAEHVPDRHWYAILASFTLLLLAEVISLVLALASSVSAAVGKQLEIMSLILVRQSFKELTYFDEPVVWDTVTGEVGTRVLYILSDAVGALVIFALLAVYTRCQRHPEFTRDDAERASFVATKKLVSLLLLAGLVVIAVDVGIRSGLTWEATEHYFEVFYTLLIFADVLVVLVSLRYSTAYPVVFRYFGFAVATVLIRLALTAPRFVDAGLGIVAALFALALTWVYNRSTGESPAGAIAPTST